MKEARPRTIITSAPPNPNGDLHLGHLSGPFLGADVLRRYLSQIGHAVSYVGYADDYSCYVPRRGAELQMSAPETAHVFGSRMEQTLALANMSPDYFTHPLREPAHKETVQAFFLELWENGQFDVVDLPVFWCEPCHRYLYEAELRGLCQFCRAPSDGFYCEECGQPQDSTGLTEPVCTGCRSTPEVRSLRRIQFNLDRFRSRLQEYYLDRPLRPRLRDYLTDMLSRPLPGTTVARRADYGVPVPLDGWDGYILDTWFSGIWGYVAASKVLAQVRGEPSDLLSGWADPDVRIYEFVGFDCGFSHALLWPALALAHGGLELPDQVVTNEFYRLEGSKFSTSRDHAIWGNDILRRVPADQLRFYLCLTGPEREQTNFSADHFKETTDLVLVQGLQAWLETVIRLVTDDFEGVPPCAPDAIGPLTKLSEGLPDRMASALDPDAFSPRAASVVLAEAVETARGSLTSLVMLRAGDREGYAEAMSVHVELLARFAAVAAPILPTFADYVWRAFRLDYLDVNRRVIPWPVAGVPVVPSATLLVSKAEKLFQTVAG